MRCETAAAGLWDGQHPHLARAGVWSSVRAISRIALALPLRGGSDFCVAPLDSSRWRGEDAFGQGGVHVFDGLFQFAVL